MSEEEKKAIEYFNCETTSQALHYGAVLVNLIETQKAEIENLKWKNNIYVKSIKSHKAEIEKKNKIIYSMARYIAQLDIDEDICSTVVTKDCDKMAFCECETCIIDYFTKLAEENKQ